MPSMQGRIDSMGTVAWNQYQRLLTDERLMAYFSAEADRFAASTSKPDDILRRFSLSGDGYLDLKEFQLAMKRLGMWSELDFSHSTSHASDASETAMKRARELFTVFCPTHVRKLDIGLFCRIMTEWSLRLMRKRAIESRQSAPSLPTPRDSLSSLNDNFIRSSYNNLDGIAAPYATERSRVVQDPRKPLIPNEAEPYAALWRRLVEPIHRSMEKLQHMFFNMDIGSTGSVKQEEFELALSHIGVFLTPQEYQDLYKSFPDNVKFAGDHASAFEVKYANFLLLFKEKDHLEHTTTSSHATPPVAGVGSGRLWDLIVMEREKLASMFHQYERIHQYELPPDSFRECLRQAGISMSNADFAALRVRLLPYTDSNGCIRLSPLVQAIADSEIATHKTAIAPQSKPPAQAATNEPKQGKRTSPGPPLDDAQDEYQALPRPAGKSNQQRDAEANRSIVRIRDESRWKSNLGLHLTQSEDQTPDNTVRQKPMNVNVCAALEALEQRILYKMHQAQQLGRPNVNSVQAVFPGDQFGKITRGQFRQSLAHIGLIARYAEVEALFWKLDALGRGYIENEALYAHLARASARRERRQSDEVEGSSSVQDEEADKRNGLYVDISDEDDREQVSSRSFSRSVQKIFEAMLSDLPLVVRLCRQEDTYQTGTVSRAQLLGIMYEAGILAPASDMQAAVGALASKSSASPDDVGSSESTSPRIDYVGMEDKLMNLCSDLLSPCKSRQHQSTTSVLLSPHERANDDNRRTLMSSGDYQEHISRRRVNYNHPAAKSSLRIVDPVMETNAVEQKERSSQGGERRNRRALIVILQELLESRGILKTVMDLYRRADLHGYVTRAELADIFLSSRLALNFSTSLTCGMSVHEFIDEMYPTDGTEPRLVSFLDVIKRATDLFAEVTNGKLDGSRNGSQATKHDRPQHYRSRRNHTGGWVQGFEGVLDSVVKSPRASKQFLEARDEMTSPPAVPPAASLRKKLLEQSRLKGLLATEHDHMSAAILVRHAFKGVSSRELVVPIDNGEFEAMCRTADIKHVCHRIGIDLTVPEERHLTVTLDKHKTGFVSSPQLLHYFIWLSRSSQSTDECTQQPNKSKDMADIKDEAVRDKSVRFSQS